MAARKPLVLVAGKFVELANADWIVMRRTWVSGTSIGQFEEVISPADGEVYRRITATGSGTTDPADDVTNYRATSYQRTVSLGPILALDNASTTVGDFFNGATKTSPGATAASARTSMLSITGRGLLEYLGYAKFGPDTARVEVFVDGRNVLDGTATFGTINFGVVIFGVVNPGPSTSPLKLIGPSPNPVVFKRSLQVYITPQTTGADATSVFAYAVRSEA